MIDCAIHNRHNLVCNYIKEMVHPSGMLTCLSVAHSATIKSKDYQEFLSKRSEVQFTSLEIVQSVLITDAEGLCPKNAFTKGLQCEGTGNCDSFNLQCDGLKKDKELFSWSTAEWTDQNQCGSNKIVVGAKCSKLCSSFTLLCASVEGANGLTFPEESCTTSNPFTNKLDCANGEVLTGIQCVTSDCGQKRLHCCKPSLINDAGINSTALNTTKTAEEDDKGKSHHWPSPTPQRLESKPSPASLESDDLDDGILLTEDKSHELTGDEWE